MPATPTPAADETVFLAVRVPKNLKRQIQQAALDEDGTVQAFVRRAIEAELGRLASHNARRTRRR